MRRCVFAEAEALYRSAFDPAGGFRVRLGHDWSPLLPDDARRVVHAARMTWCAAHLARHDARTDSPWATYCRHGAEALGGVFLDQARGGVYWEVGASGLPTPGSDGGKHAYGVAFAVFALAEAGDVLGDTELVRTASALFDWFDSHAYDRNMPGYHECLDAEGVPLRIGYARDGICRHAGEHSTNVQLHLLEAWATLTKVDPRPVVRDRLDELVGLFLDRLIDPRGFCRQYFDAGWVPTGTQAVSYGHDVETTILLLEAVAIVCPDRMDEAWSLARRVVDTAMAYGFDREQGGMCAEGPGPGAPDALLDPTKVWWVQAEAINALGLMDARYGAETRTYGEAMTQTWGFASRHLVDGEHGGWRWSTDRVGNAVGLSDKANNWKTAYHTARGLLAAADRLGAHGGERDAKR